MAQLKTTKTAMRYEVADAPDVAMKYRRFSIRPAEAVINVTDGTVSSVVVSGQSVRRDGTLGARHSEVFSSWSVVDGEIPEWIDKLVASTGIPWLKLAERRGSAMAR